VEGSYSYTFNEDKTCHVIGIMKENHWIIEKNGNLVLIDKNTLCQYTGLTDKNGNKIWENDIIQYKDIKALGKVEYIEDSFYLKHVYDYKQYIGEMWNKFEVIGNIFDNPELLEGGA
jgi:uncharacterized phage protein (TIGR01671 family)